MKSELEQLREWKSAILDKCKASDGFNSLEWGGDKEGWGFVHYFIGHLETRALHAETILAEQDGRRTQCAPTITDEMVNAAAREMWNDRDARHGGGWDTRDPREVCVIQTKATARAALTAALTSTPDQAIEKTEGGAS